MAHQLVLFNATSFAANLSTACASALSKPLACDPTLLTYASAQWFGRIDEQVLSQRLCSRSCADSLASYHTSVEAACAKDPDPWKGFPATYTGDFIWSYQNLTCLKDTKSGQSCLNYLAGHSAATDGSKAHNGIEEYLCSSCSISILHEAQKSAFSRYDENNAASFAALQAACGLGKSYPTEVPAPVHSSLNVEFGSGTGYSMSGSSNETSPLCRSGVKYTVKAGDDCNKISADSNVSTWALRVANGLNDNCDGLVPEKEVCIPKPCKTLTVQKDESCYSILSAQKLTWTNLLSYNPGLKTDCSNLAVGESICVSGTSDRGQGSSSAVSSGPPSTAISGAPSYSLAPAVLRFARRSL